MAKNGSKRATRSYDRLRALPESSLDNEKEAVEMQQDIFVRSQCHGAQGPGRAAPPNRPRSLHALSGTGYLKSI